MIKLISPKNNQIVSTLLNNVESYILAMHKQNSDIKNDYVFNGLNWGKKETIFVDDFVKKTQYVKPVIFKYESDESITLLLSLDKRFNKITHKIESKKNSIKIYNLLRNTKYYWKIISNNDESEIRSFRTTDFARCLKIGKAPNIRDFGGYEVDGGKKIKQGLLFRGCELTTKTYQYTYKGEYTTVNHNRIISKNNCKKFGKLIGSGIELDFRGEEESNFQKKSELSSKDAKFSYGRFTIGGYDETLLPKDNKIKENLKKSFEIAANANKKHIYCHCWGGADRTGTFCFLLGALLGMSYTDLIIEYELTSFCGNRRVHYKEKNDVSWLRFPELYEFLENYSLMNKTPKIKDTVEHLLINELNVSKETIDKIRSAFLN